MSADQQTPDQLLALLYELTGQGWAATHESKQAWIDAVVDKFDKLDKACVAGNLPRRWSAARPS